MKIFDKKSISGQALERARQEREMMSELDSPNIVKCQTAYEDDKMFVIVEEMMSADMRRVMEATNGAQMKEDHVRMLFYQMVLAVQYLHSHNIIHRDIKLDNFMVQQNKKGGFLEVKLSDLGLACVYDPANPPSIKCGTITNLAPEVLTRPHYDEKVDMWSLGIILFELLSGKEPYEYKDDK